MSELEAQPLTWDANGAGAGVTDGSGAWNLTDPLWWDGIANVQWNNANNDIAQFGSGGTLTTGDRTVTLGVPINAGGLQFNPVLGTVAYILQGQNLALTSGGLIQLADGGSGSEPNYRVQLDTALSGSNISIQKTGIGAALSAVQLRGNNTWTGTLTLQDLSTNAGGLFVEAYSAANLNTLTQVTVGASTTLAALTSGNLTSNYNITGTGAGGRGAIRFDASTGGVSGNIQVAGASTINVGTAGNVATLSGNISGAARLTLGSSGAAGTYVLSGTTSLTGALQLNAGTLRLGGNNTAFTGGLEINGGEVIIENAGALNSAAPTTVAFLNSASAKTLSLNGNSVSVSNMTSTGSGTITIRNGASTNATLTLTNPAGSFSGIFTDGGGGGTLSLVKNGTQRLALTNANTHTGTTTVNGGTLILRNSQALGSNLAGTIVASGARLELDTGVTVLGESLITPYLISVNTAVNTWTGTVQAAVGSSLTFEAAETSTLNVSGNVDAASTDSIAHSVSLLGTGTGTISGNFSNALAITKNGTGTWTLSGNNTYANGVRIAGGTLIVGSAGALNSSGVNFLEFVNGATAKKLQLNGNSVSVAGIFSSGAGVGASIIENGAATDAVLTINHADSRSFGGTIQNGGTGLISVVKQGAGTQTFTGQNTYTGSTTVTSGTLALVYSAAVPTNVISASSTLNMGGGTLALAGSATEANSQTFAGLNVTGGSSSIAVTKDGITPQDFLLSLGAINRTNGSINFSLAGAQTATNGIATTTTVTNPATDILGTWATVNGADWATISGGRVVAFAGYTNITQFSTGAGANGVIPDSPGANVKVVLGGTSGDISLADPVTDINSLVVDSSVTTATTISIGFSGEVLRLGANGGILLAAGAGPLNIGPAGVGAILTAGGAPSTDGILTISNFSTNDITVSARIDDNDADGPTRGVVSLVKNGTGNLILTGVNLYSGKTFFNGGSIRATDNSAFGTLLAPQADNLTFNGGTLQWGASFNLESNRGMTLLEGGGTLNLQIGATNYSSVYNGIITGSGPLTKTGGTLTLGGANTYTGVTTVQTGALVVANNSALGGTAGGTNIISGFVRLANNITVTDEVITLRGGGDNFGALQVAGGTVSAPTSATWAGNVILGGDNIRVGGGTFSTLNIAGVISDDGLSRSLSISHQNAGVVVLSGKNTYTGATNIIRGTLRLGTDNSLTAGTTLFVSSSNVNEYNGFDLAGYDQTVARLISSSTTLATTVQEVTNSNAADQSIFTVNQTTGTDNFYGRIGGNVAFVKDGAGILNLNAKTSTPSNNYTGKTTVRGGTLALIATADIDSSPWVQIDSGATFSISGRTGSAYTFTNKVLSGTGTVNGTLTVGAGSIIKPGSNPGNAVVGTAGSGFGELTFTNLTVNSAGAETRALLQLGGTASNISDPASGGSASYFANASSNNLYDTIQVNGALTWNTGAKIKVEFAAGYVASAGDVFNLFDWNSLGVGHTLQASDLDLSSVSSFNGGLVFDTSQFTTSGIIYVVVPEPNRWMLILLGASVCILRRSRCRA